MPEPKKQKRTFEAQAHSSIQGMQILPQAARKENGPANQTEGQHREQDSGPVESSLVNKLIDFLKAMD